MHSRYPRLVSSTTALPCRELPSSSGATAISHSRPPMVTWPRPTLPVLGSATRIHLSVSIETVADELNRMLYSVVVLGGAAWKTTNLKSTICADGLRP